jgi:hypothetical protein
MAGAASLTGCSAGGGLLTPWRFLNRLRISEIDAAGAALLVPGPGGLEGSIASLVLLCFFFFYAFPDEARGSLRCFFLVFFFSLSLSSLRGKIFFLSTTFFHKKKFKEFYLTISRAKRVKLRRGIFFPFCMQKRSWENYLVN